MCGVNNETSINILDKVESKIIQNSITFTEFEDCRHEYLRLWMSGVFDDQKFTILNKWSQNDTSINILDKVESIITQNSITFSELEDYMHEIYDYEWAVYLLTKSLQVWISGVNNDTSINILQRVKSLIS